MGLPESNIVLAKLPPETFPHLTAHYERMLARPAVQKTIEVESDVGYELPA
ncbi:hypothetical protein [Bradyrhizobium uaiense]|uniref:hypothetical protein n=1 Tax=Bradyrhizobium uaiense TaxID=2594946 RepID=UPI0013D1AA2A|nr:hypothetical protein [Bradyrhizobium uaiense]